MQTLSQIKSLLDSRGLRPKRSLGQNFLIDHNLIRSLIDKSGVRQDDGGIVVEVGPGTGTLTEELLARGLRVIACELDDALADMLIERSSHDEIPNGKHLTVLRGDCLASKHQLSPALDEHLRGISRFSLVANLPYGAATPLMMILLARYPACATIAVTVQREVADRVLAGPGSKDYGPLGVLAGATAESHRIANLPPECFWPRPDVHSSMIVLRRLSIPKTTDATALADFAQKLFAHRRKQIGSVLGKDALPALAQLGIDPKSRAEELPCETIESLRLALPHAESP